MTELAAREFFGVEPAAMVSWFDVTPEQAVRLLDDLAAWLAEVGLHYRQVRVALSDCWFRHAAAVDALNALRLAWLVAYRGPQASASMAVDWQIRSLPGLTGLAEADLRGCSEASHGPDGTATRADGVRLLPAPEDPRLAEHAGWWASGRQPAAVPRVAGASSA